MCSHSRNRCSTYAVIQYVRESLWRAVTWKTEVARKRVPKHKRLKVPKIRVTLVDIWTLKELNLTKYCACHAKLHSKIKEKFAENSWSVNSNAGTIRAWSENDPSMNSSSRTRPFAEVTFRASETHFVLKITTFRASAIYPNFTEYCACHKKWHSKIPKCCASHKKWHSKITKYCACHKKWHSKITKYCACHEQWCASLIVVTYETSFTMRGATGITLQPHQILRLPRKIALQNYPGKRPQTVFKGLFMKLMKIGDHIKLRGSWDHGP